MTTGYDARQAEVNIPPPTAEVEEASAGSPETSSAPTSERVAQTVCEWLSEMPTGVGFCAHVGDRGGAHGLVRAGGVRGRLGAAAAASRIWVKSPSTYPCPYSPKCVEKLFGK
jgi:hypothetical protein